MKVWVLAISHRHGTDVSVHRSEAGALDNLFSYVGDWWENDAPREEVIPHDRGEAIDRYFELVTDEFYSLEATELLS